MTTNRTFALKSAPASVGNGSKRSVLACDAGEILAELALGPLHPRLVGARTVLGGGLDLFHHTEVVLGKGYRSGLDPEVAERLEDADELLVLLVIVHGTDDNPGPPGNVIAAAP